MSTIKDCPRCGAKDALETFLRIDLDDVELAAEPDQWGRHEIVDFVPAHSANDPDTGLVVEEAQVSCRECGAEHPTAHVPMSIMRHWRYHAREPVTLVIRDPDYSDEIVHDGPAEPRTIYVDLGADFNGPKDFEPDSDWGREWLADTRAQVADLPPDSPVRQRVEELCDNLIESHQDD